MIDGRFGRCLLPASFVTVPVAFPAWTGPDSYRGEVSVCLRRRPCIMWCTGTRKVGFVCALAGGSGIEVAGEADTGVARDHTVALNESRVLDSGRWRVPSFPAGRGSCAEPDVRCCITCEMATCLPRQRFLVWTQRRKGNKPKSMFFLPKSKLDSAEILAQPPCTCWTPVFRGTIHPFSQPARAGPVQRQPERRAQDLPLPLLCNVWLVLADDAFQSQLQRNVDVQYMMCVLSSRCPCLSSAIVRYGRRGNGRPLGMLLFAKANNDDGRSLPNGSSSMPQGGSHRSIDPARDMVWIQLAQRDQIARTGPGSTSRARSLPNGADMQIKAVDTNKPSWTVDAVFQQPVSSARAIREIFSCIRSSRTDTTGYLAKGKSVPFFFPARLCVVEALFHLVRIHPNTQDSSL